MSDFAETDRLVEVRLKEERRQNRPHAIQQELEVAMFDLTEENRFRVRARPGEPAPEGPYVLDIGMAGRMLALEVRRATDAADADDRGETAEIHLSLSPLRGVIKDYFAICESYFDAVKRLPPEKIEAIDMGRRGVHEEGARTLAERLEGKIEADHDTYRRLFTVICALQHRG